MPLPLLAFAIPPLAEMMATVGGAVAVGSLAYASHDAILETRDDIMGFIDDQMMEHEHIKAIPKERQLTKVDIKATAKPKLEEKRNQILSVPAQLKAKAVNHEYVPVKDIALPFNDTLPLSTSTTGTSLISVLNEKNKLIAENNALILASLQIQHAQTEQLEIANRLSEAKIYSDTDMKTAQIVMLNDINTTLKGQLEVMQKGTVVQSEDTKKYFSALASYFDFMNTGKIADKENFFGQEVGQYIEDGGAIIIPREAKAKANQRIADNVGHLEKLTPISDYHTYKNTASIQSTDGTTTTPREAEAKHHAEKYQETKSLNETDFSSFIIDNDYENPFELIKNIFNPANVDFESLIKENLKEGE